MTNTTCAACGAQQAPGGAWCAVCGTELPRQGSSAAVPAPVPVPVHTGTTEPERIGATVRGYAPPSTTPDAPPAYAHTGRRFAAWVIDSVVLAILPVVILAVGISASGVPLDGGLVAVTPEEAQGILGTLVAAYAMSGAAALACWIAVVAVEGRTGRTPAGLLLGLHTVDADTMRPIGFWRCALRWFLLGVSVIGLGVGPILMALSPAFDSGRRRQGWHDKAARSVVLHRAAGDRGGPAFGPAQPGAPVSAAPAPRAVVGAPSPAAAAHADPWEFPAPTPAAAGGLITGIPGGGTAAGPSPAPAAPAPAVAAPAGPFPAGPTPVVPASVVPAPAAAVDDVDGETRMTPARPRVLALELATGERQAITGRTLLGRNPQAPAGEPWDVVTVPDPTRSVSKTHAELHPDPGGLWIVDRGSTNGTVVSVPGRAPQVVAAGSRVRVTAGATVHLGDARLLIRSDAS